MRRTHVVSAVLLFTLLLTMALASGALADKESPTPSVDDHVKPNLVLYGVETNFAYNDACPFVSQDETPEQRDQRCEEEPSLLEEPEEGAEEPPPHAFVADTFVVDEAVYFDEAHEQEAGVNKITCTFSFNFSQLCEGALALQDGNLFWSAYISFEEEEDEVTGAHADEGDSGPEYSLFATVGITGGTGAYVGAEGYADIYDAFNEETEEVLSRYEIHVVH